MSFIRFLAKTEACYIGRTGRNLSQRITEHRRAVRKLDTFSSAMSEHVCQTGHSINWDNPFILAHHPFLWQRVILESWHINNKCPSINREKGLLPGTYVPHITVQYACISAHPRYTCQDAEYQSTAYVAVHPRNACRNADCFCILNVVP